MGSERFWFFCLFWVFLRPVELIAQDAGFIGESDYLLLGSCNLREDPSQHIPSHPIFCIRGKVGVESVLSSGPSFEDMWGRYADASISVYLKPWLSLSARGRDREFHRFSQSSNQEKYRDAEYVVLNLGNPVLHKVRLTAGHMRPPFGIDRPDVDEFYRINEDRRFWPGPTTSAGFTFDDLRATELDIGVARYRNKLDIERFILKGDSHDVVTARLMRDFAGNGATRLVLSGGVDSAGSRLYGLGFVNQAPNHDQLVFEVVRRLPQPDGSNLEDEIVTQIIRLGFIGHYDRGARWIFHLDDERDRFRRGLLEFNYSLTNYLILRLGTSYKIEIDNGVNRAGRWFMISGFEGRL
jgi:hypothetical protein